MSTLDILAPALSFAVGWLLARRRYGPAYVAAVQADLAALRALVELSDSPPDPAASEAPSGAHSSLSSASPERSGGAAFLPDWDGKPSVSIAVALALSAVAWAGLIWVAGRLI